MSFRANPITPAVDIQANGPMPEAAEEEVAEMVEHLRAALESPIVFEAVDSPLIPGSILGPDDWAAEEHGPALDADLFLG